MQFNTTLIILFTFLSFNLFAQSGSEFTGDKFEGSKFEIKDVLSYDELLDVMTKKGGAVDVQIKGLVDGVCQAKGCWMTMVSSEMGKDTMFVKFKDYAFFMPKDLGGQEVIIHGDAYYEETTVEELRHYAEDEGKSQEEILKINEPVKELKFLADGVIFQ